MPKIYSLPRKRQLPLGHNLQIGLSALSGGHPNDEYDEDDWPENGCRAEPTDPRSTVNHDPSLRFDGDCGFCAAAVHLARTRVAPQVRFVPWQIADLDALGVTCRVQRLCALAADCPA
ncbi:hypothetical protein ACFVJM_06250 [Streptomyces virginiae]|uniref:hypothetical protein n=1 Tax=Streptomyces virginiae TaxID=1961 RepID=UPI003638CAE3